MSDDLLICTDLDRTLIPNGPLPESPGARKQFSALVTRPDVRLAYVSGRNLASVRDAMRLYALPRPDFVIADVGTNIHRPDNGGWKLIADWHKRIAVDWGDADRDAIKSMLTGVDGLRAQEPAKQERFKLSFYVPLYLGPAAVKAGIGDRLQPRGIQAKLIYSVDELRGIGLLDLLPAGASKFHAIEFLLERLRLAFDACLFAGASGNDLEVLVSPIPSVLVANGSEAVRQKALSDAMRSGTRDRLYCARGGRGGMNGNYAAGILEGIAHFHPDLHI
jgi:HAD superfamily hydrolase (TIGR01484 family)